MDRRQQQTEKYRLIDLFCGAGGLTLGFTEAFGHHFVPVWANDLDASAVATYDSNFGQHCTPGDIGNLLKDSSTKIPKADVVVGGPPCQGFSLLNKNRRGDSRKQLWRPFLEVVEASEADVFLMENVPQLLESREYDNLVEAAERDLGFQVRSAKLLAADYGVPQVRQRAFLIGCRFADPNTVFPPRKTHYNPKNGYAFGMEGYVQRPYPWQTVRDAIADLPPPQGTDIRDEAPPLDLQFGRTPKPVSVKRYRAVPTEGMNRFDLQRRAPKLTPPCWIRKTTGGTDLFGRLWWDRPACTMRTEFFKPEKGRYLHPSEHRPITHREAARFQSFPDDFRFCGNKIAIAKQIGNAVPPLLAARLADCVAALLRQRADRRHR
jgi:DNA (cytosine-5)-methyltransferase 1